MKAIVSIFVAVISLLATVVGNHGCDRGCVGIERSSTESSEPCENLLTAFKIGNRAATIKITRPSLIAYTFHPVHALHIPSTAARLVLAQRSVKQYTSLLYLNNRVFLI